METTVPYVSRVQPLDIDEHQADFMSWGADGSAPGHNTQIFKIDDNSSKIRDEWDNSQSFDPINTDTSKYLAVSGWKPGHLRRFMETAPPC